MVDSQTPPPIPGRKPPTRRPPSRRASHSANKDTANHSKQITNQKPKTLSCVNCAGSCEIRDQDETVMVVCSYCGTAMDVTVPGVAQKVAQYAKEKLGGPLAIGDSAKISKHVFVVVGRVRYCQYEDGDEYIWDEYQLYNKRHGYIFLSLENGHWTLFRKIKLNASLPNFKHLRWRQSFKYENKVYRVFEAGGTATIEHVEGELSWIAKKGDHLSFTDAISPPDTLSAEWTKTELEWYKGRYQAPQQIAAVFGKSLDHFDSPAGVAPAQAFLRMDSQRMMMNAGWVASAILFVLILWSLGQTGNIVLQSEFPSSEYLSANGALTDAFDVEPGQHIYQIKMSANVVNAWIASSFAVIDENDNVVADVDAAAEYYQGRDAEGNWSEGSQSDTTLLRLTGPARLKLNVFGEVDPSAQNILMRVQLKKDVLPVRYFFIALLLALLYPMKEFARKVTFESQRWPSDDDD